MDGIYPVSEELVFFDPDVTLDWTGHEANHLPDLLPDSSPPAATPSSSEAIEKSLEEHIAEEHAKIERVTIENRQFLYASYYTGLPFTARDLDWSLEGKACRVRGISCHGLVFKTSRKLRKHLNSVNHRNHEAKLAKAAAEAEAAQPRTPEIQPAPSREEPTRTRRVNIEDPELESQLISCPEDTSSNVDDNVDGKGLPK